MRFLIFNCLIIASLSYLLTAQPGDSVTSWMREFPGEFEKKFDSHLNQTLSSKDASPVEKEVHFNDVSNMASIEKKKVNSAEKSGAYSDQEYIKQLIDEAIKQKNQSQLVVNNTTDDVPVHNLKAEESFAESKSGAQKTNSTSFIKEENLVRDDSTIGNEFKTLELGIKSGIQESNALAENVNDNQKKGETKQHLFMTGSQRQLALSQLMQDMEMFYAETLAQ